MKSYSANDLLRILAQNMDFQAFTFDDRFWPEIKLVDKRKNGVRLRQWDS